jgi:hypothetical protein
MIITNPITLIWIWIIVATLWEIVTIIRKDIKKNV